MLKKSLPCNLKAPIISRNLIPNQWNLITHSKLRQRVSSMLINQSQYAKNGLIYVSL